MRPSDQNDIDDRLSSWLGTALMACASVMAILIFADRTADGLFVMPALWYRTRSFHVLIGLALFLLAAVLLKSRRQAVPGELAPGPVFHSVRVFSRAQCDLCDHALATLQEFHPWLPVPEVIRIDGDEKLTRQFGESVPVVEIDGRIRFRGAVHPVLLQRLIDGAIRQRESDGQGRAAARREVSASFDQESSD